MSLGKLHAPLLAACRLLCRTDAGIGPRIRIVFKTGDSADVARQAAALGVHLAREYGLEGSVRITEGRVTIYLSARPMTDGVGHSSRGSAETQAQAADA